MGIFESVRKLITGEIIFEFVSCFIAENPCSSVKFHGRNVTTVELKQWKYTRSRYIVFPYDAHAMVTRSSNGATEVVLFKVLYIAIM